MFLQIDFNGINVTRITRVQIINEKHIIVMLDCVNEEGEITLLDDNAARFLNWWHNKAEVYVA